MKLSARSTGDDDQLWDGYDKPPAVEARLIEIYQGWLGRGNVSQAIPAQPLEAASWWIQHQEPENKRTEKPERMSDKRGNFAGWRTPYHSRVCENFKIFLGLLEAERMFVIQHIDAGIPWRGDSIKFYKLNIAQQEAMAKDIDGYKQIAEAVRKQVTNEQP